ncbi:NAD(P)-binding protein [Tessaracoccus sp. HDW20]|nr:NAD(P)-binding protein [Tessaracoccus coleopterorum]
MTAVVIGGGLAGLIAARRYRAAGLDPVVLESSASIGGMIRSVTLGGVRVDGGAEAYATRSPAARALAGRLGLEVAGPAGRPHVWWSDSIVPLADGVLGIPDPSTTPPSSRSPPTNASASPATSNWGRRSGRTRSPSASWWPRGWGGRRRQARRAAGHRGLPDPAGRAAARRLRPAPQAGDGGARLTPGGGGRAPGAGIERRRTAGRRDVPPCGGALRRRAGAHRHPRRRPAARRRRFRRRDPHG